MILLLLVFRFFGLPVVTCHTVDALIPIAASAAGTLSVASSRVPDPKDFTIASRRALKVAHYFYLQFDTHVSGAYTEVMHCTADSITYCLLLLIKNLRFKKNRQISHRSFLSFFPTVFFLGFQLPASSSNPSMN